MPMGGGGQYHCGWEGGGQYLLGPPSSPALTHRTSLSLALSVFELLGDPCAASGALRSQFAMPRYDESDELIPGTFTPRTEDKGWLGNQIDAFTHMNALGADVMEAAMAAFAGHRMTPELAASCIATYWRRYTAIANFQESRGAAITLQANMLFQTCAALPERASRRSPLARSQRDNSDASPAHAPHASDDTRAARSLRWPGGLQKIRLRQLLAACCLCCRWILHAA